MSDLSEWREALADRVEKDSGTKLIARCPAHDDETPSLTVEVGRKGVVAKCHAGCSFEEIRAALGLKKPAKRSGLGRIVATYDYPDERGALLFQKVRYEPKDFRARVPNGSGWSYKLGDVPRVLYRTPQLKAAIASGEVVYIVEGEKDADALAAQGLCATTNFDGAAKDGQQPKWRRREAEQLAGAREVVVIPDNDDAGRAHARAIITTLAALSPAPRVRVLEPPNLEPKGDISDWFGEGHTVEELKALAAEAPEGAEWLRMRQNDAQEPETEPGEPREQRLTADLSEDSLTQAFTATLGDSLKFVRHFGAWFIWDGSVWREDSTLKAFELARASNRREAALAQLDLGGNLNRKVRSAATAAAVVKLAQSDPVHATTPDVWDADPFLLPTPGGTVDLRTGAMRPNAPADLCTKLTRVAPGGDCPRWKQFLDEATASDRELIDYLQRLAGYALTGSTREHALIFVHGPGGSGKSTLLRTLEHILGDYATTAPIATFTESANEAHPTELARLRGRRLVTSNETEEGRRWAEARIKMLTGGDRIAARYMRQDFFEYVPQFTLIIAGNHRPKFRSPDTAIRRRLHLVPFTHTPREIDPLLDEKLAAEGPGILSWAIEGCAQWQQHGLKPPESVLAATNDYLEAEDTLAAWLDECTTADPNGWTDSASLFASWRMWAEGRGEFVGSMRRFSTSLTDRGFVSERNAARTLRGLRGIRLQPTLALAPNAPVIARDAKGREYTTTLAEIEEQKGLLEFVRPAA